MWDPSQDHESQERKNRAGEVKDRGPYGDKKLKFDVSRRAARRLGMIKAGRVPIKAVVLHK